MREGGDWLSPRKNLRGQKTIGHCFLNNRLLFPLFSLLFLKILGGRNAF